MRFRPWLRFQGLGSIVVVIFEIAPNRDGVQTPRCGAHPAGGNGIFEIAPNKDGAQSRHHGESVNMSGDSAVGSAKVS